MLRFHMPTLAPIALLLGALACSSSNDDEPRGSAGSGGTGGSSGSGGAAGSGNTGNTAGTGGAVVGTSCFAPTAGPNDTSEALIAATSSNLFIGTAHGLFRSDGSEVEQTPFVGRDVTALATLGDDVFVGVVIDLGEAPAPISDQKVGLYRGSQNGTVWQTANAGLPNAASYAPVVQLASSDDKLLAVVNHELFVWDASATSWTAIPLEQSFNAIDTAEFDGDSIYVNSALLTGVFRWDAGSWTEVTDLPAWGYKAFAFDGPIALAARDATIAAQSSQGWADTNTFGSDVFDLLAHSGVAYAATENGVAVSTDAGETWTETLAGGTSSRAALAVRGDETFAFTRKLHVSGDGGQNWTTAPAVFSHVEALAAADLALVAVTDDGRVHRSLDGGQSYQPVPLGPSAQVVAAGDTLLAAQGGGLFRSTNAGSSFAPLAIPPELGFSPLRITATESAVYLGGSSWMGDTCGGKAPGPLGSLGFFRSTDAGATWQDASEGLPVTYSCSGDPTYPTVEAVIEAGELSFALTSHGTFRSTNQGTSWTALEGVELTSVVAVGDALVGGTKSGIVLSDDGGETWTAAAGLADASIVALVASDGAVYASVGSEPSGGVWASPDAGATWTRWDPALTSRTGPLLIHDGSLYTAVAGRAVWRASLSGCSK